MRIEKNQYIFSHGKAPRGYGMWAFEVADREYFYTGNFAEAKKEAFKEARNQGVSEIVILP